MLVLIKQLLVFFAFAICGAFAGIAGLAEVSGPIGLLYRDISPNYGFTAIIVAFLGRLHPIGIIFAFFSYRSYLSWC